MMHGEAGSAGAVILVDGGLASLLACHLEGVCRAPTAGRGRGSGAAAGRNAGGVGGGATVGVGGRVGESAGPTAASMAMLFPSLSGTTATDGGSVTEHSAAMTVARRAVELSGLAGVVVAELGAAGGSRGGAGGPGVVLTDMLIVAGREAIARGMSRVVWPVHFGPGSHTGPDLVAVSGAFDRAMAVGRLLTLELPADRAGLGFSISTPFIDLTDGQLAELAADADLPPELAYAATDGPERWSMAFAAVGLPTPGALALST